MNLPIRISIFGIIILVYLASVGRGEELANVNGSVISTEDFQKQLKELSKRGRNQPVSPENRHEVLDILVGRELLYQEAQRQKIEKSKDAEAKLAIARKNALIEVMMNRLMSEKLVEQELRSYYASHPDLFREVRASHIMVQTEAESITVQEQLKGGADFAEMAVAYSKDTRSGPAGGDLGYFTRNRMPEPLREVIFSLKVNEVSDPIQTPYGFHIIKVTDIRPRMSFDKLPNAILQEIKRAVLQDEITKLRKKAKVMVNEKLLNRLP
jgi:peptidyl-prolyl cis-trans isomerase C